MKNYEVPKIKINKISVDDIIITSDPTIHSSNAQSDLNILAPQRDSDWSNWEN